MSVKRYAAAPEVLDVLKGMRFESTGGAVIGVIQTQLDRKLYENVNKFLVAMGGKWNRKAGGHIFTEDPRSLVDGLLDSGKLEVDNMDFFPTPAIVTARMIALSRKNLQDVFSAERILEPSAGDGAICDYLVELGYPQDHIDVCELDWKRREKLEAKGYRVVGQDFLAFKGRYPCILMNPPFSGLQDVRHVLHAYALLEKGGFLVSVMAGGQTWHSDREICRKFRQGVEQHGMKVDLPEGSFAESGTGVRSVQVYLEKAE